MDLYMYLNPRRDHTTSARPLSTVELSNIAVRAIKWLKQKLL